MANDVQAVEACLDAGYPVDHIMDRAQGWTPLLFAAYYGKPAVIRSLLIRGANLTHTDLADRSALHLSA